MDDALWLHGSTRVNETSLMGSASTARWACRRVRSTNQLPIICTEHKMICIKSWSPMMDNSICEIYQTFCETLVERRAPYLLRAARLSRPAAVATSRGDGYLTTYRLQITVGVSACSRLSLPVPPPLSFACPASSWRTTIQPQLTSWPG